MDFPISAPGIGLVGGKFVDENPLLGTPGSLIPSQWGNAVTEEILNVISAAGLAPDEESNNQLIAAIRLVNKQPTLLTDTGAANVYSATNSPALTALPGSGYFQHLVIAHANTGASTYAPDGFAAKPIYGLGLQPLQGGELPVGVAVLMYLVQAEVNGGNGAWIIIESLGGASQIAPATKSQHAIQLGQASSLFAPPIGEMKWFSTMAPPAGFMAADGASVSRTTYADLFNAITARPTGNVTSGSNSISSVTSPSSMWVGMPISGTGIPAGATVTAVGASTITLSANATATATGVTVAICPFGVGNGSTTFNVPDGRGKVPRGWDGTAGLDPSRVFGSYQADMIASHTHDYGAAVNVQSGSGNTVVQGGATGVAATRATGGVETRMKNLALLACVKY